MEAKQKCNFLFLDFQIPNITAPPTTTEETLPNKLKKHVKAFATTGAIGGIVKKVNDTVQGNTNLNQPTGKLKFRDRVEAWKAKLHSVVGEEGPQAPSTAETRAQARVQKVNNFVYTLTKQLRKKWRKQNQDIVEPTSEPEMIPKKKKHARKVGSTETRIPSYI